MKNLLPLLFILSTFLPLNSFSNCITGQSELIVVIVPDWWPNEIHWSVRYEYSGALIDSGDAVGDTMCITIGECVRFTIYDDFGDGIIAPGYYLVSLDGNTIVQSSGTYTEESEVFNCPPGYLCSSAFPITEGSHVAPFPDSWYIFVADSTGTYTISTCDPNNTCDTRIYTYDHCVGIIYNDAVLGTEMYNDDFCGVQSETWAGLATGDSIWIRIGDAGTACAGSTIDWQLYYSGPVIGCMDASACNYNPLAVVDTGGCVYSGPLCEGPDLAVDYDNLVNSMMMLNYNWNDDCYISEGCLLGYGQRDLMAYSVQIWNYGELPWIVGTATSNPDAFEFDPCHGHYHYLGFAGSFLFDQNDQMVEFSRKTQYAVVDMQCLAGSQSQYWGGQALSPGCSDIYGAGTFCQWADITDVDPGQYTLVVGVNWNEVDDNAGNDEKTYSNNWVNVCVDIFYDAFGNKDFQILPNCPVFVDCAGDTFGLAQLDCAGVCGGSAIRGDVNIDDTLSTPDLDIYMTGIAAETMGMTTCNDLTGEGLLTVLDAARLNGCLRNTDSTHFHPNGWPNTHEHCMFPMNVLNQFDTVTIGIANLNQQDKYFDVSIFNPDCYLLGFEFRVGGAIIDSVVNITGNYSPYITYNTNGHVVVLAADEFSLNKNYVAPLNVLRLYYASLTDINICIEEIIDVVNSDYEQNIGVIGPCQIALTTGAVSIESSPRLFAYPNPTNGTVHLLLDGAVWQNAQLQVLNQVGQVVHEEIMGAMNNEYEVDLSSYSEGTYYLCVQGKEFAQTAKVIVLHER